MTASSTSSGGVPMRPLLALVLGRIAEGANWAVILPYINTQLALLGVSPAKIGLVSGSAEAILMLTESLVGPVWAIASDVYGRKTLYLIGLGFHSLFCVLYGFSDQVWQILLWRLALGSMAGCGVLSRTLLVEMCDESAVVKAFGMFSPALTFGMTIGPWIGGMFSRPADQFPALFSSSIGQSILWPMERWPYLLPNLICGLIGLTGTIYGKMTIPETLAKPSSAYRRTHARRSSSPNDSNSHPFTEKPHASPLRMLLTDSKFLTMLTLYGCQQAVSFGFDLLLPLILFTSPTFGGLGQSPVAIGNVIGGSALFGMAMTLTTFPWLAAKLERKTFLRLTVWSYLVSVTLLPIVAGIVTYDSLSARKESFATRSSSPSASGQDASGMSSTGLSVFAWIFLGTAVILKRFADFAQSLMDAMVPSAIPHPSALASANSLTFSIGGLGRAGGTFVFGSLFGLSTSGAPFSLRRNFVWLFTIALALTTGLASARFHPNETSPSRTNSATQIAQSQDRLQRDREKNTTGNEEETHALFTSGDGDEDDVLEMRDRTRDAVSF